MIDRIWFIHIDWLWIVLAVSVLLVAVLLIKEWKSKQRRRLALRSVISILGVLCLAAIALRPAISVEIHPKNAVILTEGSSSRLLDSLHNKYDLDVLKYTAGEDLFLSGRAYDSLFVLGDGLERFDLWQLDGKWVQYLPEKRPSGVVRIKYPHKIIVGKELRIDGIYRNNKGSKQILMETSEGYALDSVIIKEDQEMLFSLTAETKTAGRFVHHLTVKDSAGSVISKDPLPVIIKNEEPLHILMVNNFPTFEMKYLKNYLSEEGHAVAVRNQLTKGKFQYEYYNHPAKEVKVLTEDNLKFFDLLIVDALSLRELSKKEKQAVEGAIRTDGMGLFILPDELLFKETAKAPAALDYTEHKDSEVIISGQRINKYPYAFKQGFTLMNVHTSGNVVLSAYHMLGSGKVGSTMLDKTYTLLLKGEDEIYRQLWTEIIESHSKTKGAVSEWKNLTAIPVAFPHQPFSFQLRTSESTPEVFSDHSHVPLAQDIDLPDVWHGNIWPKTKGWQTISILQDSLSRYDFYVADTGHWKALIADDKRIANQNKIEQSEIIALSIQREWQQMDLIWFYLMFMFCIGYLWLEPKL